MKYRDSNESPETRFNMYVTNPIAKLLGLI